MSKIALKLLDRGFVLIPGFLDIKEIEVFRKDYDKGQFDQTVYTLGHATPETIELISQKINTLLTEFDEIEEFHPSRFGGGTYFSTEKGINFGWHQDHESYFVNQTHQHYLNIYIPIKKPELDRTNLCVIPIDRFRERAPEAWSALQWGGASTAQIEHGCTTISDDHVGGVRTTLDFELEELCETPTLAVGDALLLRGDIFHRTQDNDTARVALSVRAFNPNIKVAKEHYEQSCPTKRWFQENNPMYEAISQAFEDRHTMNLSDLLAFMFKARQVREQAEKTK